MAQTIINLGIGHKESSMDENTLPSTVTAVTPPCMMCGDTSRIEVDRDQYLAWRRGTLIQQAFPEMSPADREHLKSGTHPACWDDMTKGEDL